MLIGSPIYITCFLWLCQAMKRLGAESERFIFHPAHMEDPVFQSPNQTLTLHPSMWSVVLLHIRYSNTVPVASINSDSYSWVTKLALAVGLC